jgi:hypothetical protein
MVDLIEIRMLALAGLLAVMIGTTSLFWVGVVVADRLRARVRC